MSGKHKFTPTVCTECGQTRDYLMRIDKGTAHIVMAVGAAVARLGRNKVHLAKELLAKAADFPSYNDMVSSGFMTMRMQGNVQKPRYFGLIAYAEKGGGSGEYLLTPKGARFLRNEPVEVAAIIDKRTHTKRCYVQELGTTTITELLKKDVGLYWEVERAMRSEGISFEVLAGEHTVPLFGVEQYEEGAAIVPPHTGV